MAGFSWARVLAGAMVVGAVLWMAAGVLVVWQPGDASAGRVYSALVPAALVLLVVGFSGLDAWLAGGRTRPRSRRGGLGRSVLAMSSHRHEAIRATGAGGDGPGLSARRAGVLAMRAGTIAVVVASLALQGGVGPLRSLLFFGWFLFFAGAVAFGVAVVASEEAPRRAGVLVLAGSLLVFPTIATVLGGTARRPEAVGPLLPSVGGGLVPSLVLWLLFGAGCAWLGAAAWTARPGPSRASR